MKIPVLLSTLLCRSCRGTPNDYYEAPTLYQLYDVPVSSSGAVRPMVSLEVEKVTWRQKEKGVYVAFAAATILCPDCREPHNLQQELEAPRILLEMAGKCRSCKGPLSLTQESIEYTDRGEGEPKIEVSGLLVCQDCIQKTSISGQLTSKDLPEILAKQELKLKVDESQIRLPDMKVDFADKKPIGMPRYQNSQQSELRIFLCHSSDDKPAIRNLYNRKKADGFQPWFDEENLIPGQDWNLEI